MEIKRIFLVVASVVGMMSQAASATTTDAALSVTATIKPMACAIDVADGGTFDYGDFTINDNTTKTLPRIDSKLNINCIGPTKVAFRVINNRVESVPGNSFGLGIDGSGNAIGNFKFRFEADAKLDSTSRWMISSTNNGVSWEGFPGTENFFSVAGTRLYSFTDSYSDNPPVAATTFAVVIGVLPTVQPKQSLDVSKAVLLDGSATFELIYL